MAVALGSLIACGSTQPLSLGSSDRVPGAVTVGVAQATIGSISVQTSYAAVAEASDQVDLVPASSGLTEELAVDVGSIVTSGQVIARLRRGTLDAQVDQSLASLRESRARLASVLAGVAPKQRSAQAKLDSALTAKNQLINPTASQLEAAESTVATARSSLDSATITLDQLIDPTAADLQRAASAVATAQSILDNADTRLDLLLDPSAAAQQVALGAVTTAKSNLDSAEAALDQLLNPSPAEVAAAREAVSTDQSKLSAAQSLVNGAISAKLVTVGLPADFIQAWTILLHARVREQSNSETLNDPARSASLTQNDLEGLRQAVLEDQLMISAQLSKIASDSVIPEDISTALVAENSAITTLNTSQEELKELEEPSSSTLAVARNKAAIYQSDLDSANARLAELGDAGSGPISLAQNDVAAAQAALDSAEANRFGLQNPTLATIALAESSVDAAQAALDATESGLNSLLNPTPAQLAAAEVQVASAQQALALAMPPQSEYDVEVAQANLDKAQAQLDLVRQKLADLEVQAPFDGIITRRWLAPGGWASPQSPIFTLASANVTISIQVPETEVSSLQIGQRVEFTSPALPGKILELTVDRIAPAGVDNSFSFQVMLEPTGPTPELRPGMSGDVTVITQLDAAVLVPKEALVRQGGRPAVFAIRDGRAELRIVGVGLKSETFVEVRGGIQPGEEVVISGHNLLRAGDLVVIEELVDAATSTS